MSRTEQETIKIRQTLQSIDKSLQAIARALQPTVNKAENDKHSQE